MSTCRTCGYTSGWDCTCPIYQCDECSTPLSIADACFATEPKENHFIDRTLCRTCYDQHRGNHQQAFDFGDTQFAEATTRTHK